MRRVQMPSAILSWSGGKDSALALHAVRQAGEYHIAAMITTVTEPYDRSSMHGIRGTLIEEQAASLGIPLEKVMLSPVSSNEEYDSRMQELLERHKAEGVSAVVFGDIHLEDVRQYREKRLASIGMQGLFPLWGRDTFRLARGFLDRGFKAVVTCVDTGQLDKGFAGRPYDEDFLASLPEGVDPCGENGEFHSFVYDGPIFAGPIAHATGEIVLRDGRFCFCDILPRG